VLDDDFNQKNSLAHKVEEAISSYYNTHFKMKAHLPRVPVAGYDIVCPDVGNIEVKEDRMAHISDNYAIEYKNYNDEPSGLMGTEAETFVIVDYDNVIISSTENLRYLVENCERKRNILMGYRKASGRQCKGWLVPRGEILYSPFVEVIPRWFPHWRYVNGKLY
jgi:hypothetical protein